MRATASDKSEMVSQLLFGERFEVLKEEEKWTQIKGLNDEYKGWIDNKQYLSLSIDDYHKISIQGTAIVNELLAQLHYKGGFLNIPIGSELPNLKNDSFTLGGTKYSLKGSSQRRGHQEVTDILNLAYLYLNAPYLWGGRSPFGIDCSGLVQVVYKIAGIHLPRDAYQQGEAGIAVESLAMAKAGDLAFFHNAEGRIIHVGILPSNQEIIHASGKVRIDLLDEQGIYNVDTKSYSHQLHSIRRVIAQDLLA